MTTSTSSNVLAVDVGTTAVKAAVFDGSGAELGSHSEEYSLLTPRSGHVELDAATYTETFALAVRRVLADTGVSAESIAVLGLSAQGETFVCLDEQGEPLSRAIVWMDMRAAKEADELEAHFGRERIHEVTGQAAMDAIFPAPKLLWLRRNEPELFARTATFALLKDYLVQKLTGHLVSEDSLLCTTILWDINTRGYWREMLDHLEIDESRLPKIARQGEIVGTVTAEAAAQLGLPEGIPVSVGALDQACGALGVGNAQPGTFSESTGSAMASVTIIDELRLDDEGRVPSWPAAIPGTYMLHTYSTGGMVMRWFRDRFGQPERSIEEVCGLNAYQLIDKEVQATAPGADGLIVLPHLQGAGPPDLDPYARGVFYGLTLAHTKAHLARGIMEGVAMVLRRMYDGAARLGVEVDEVISLSGGAQSEAWCQIKADMLQLPVYTLRSAESAACAGAAYLAGAAAGLWDDAAEKARSFVEKDREYVPNPDNAAVYDEQYAKYAMLQDALRALSRYEAPAS